MTTASASRVHELREIFGKVFDAQWARKELPNYDELREKFVFHMTDAIDSVEQLANLYRSNGATNADQVAETIYGFFLHAVPHLEAAAQIYDFIPATFPEQNVVHSKFEYGSALAQAVEVSADTLTVDLTDGRTISVPLLWYPRLAYGTPEERNHWELGSGIGIHWPDLDEDISVENLLRGQPSGESQTSLQRWLDQRKQRVAS